MGPPSADARRQRGHVVSLVAIGLLAQTMHDTRRHCELDAGMIILYIGCFGLSVGPVVWVILSKSFPPPCAARALGLATFFLWTADYIVTQTVPADDRQGFLVCEKLQSGRPLTPQCRVLRDPVDRRLAALSPETKGRSLEEIERSWD